jgi:hypothetical protein
VGGTGDAYGLSQRQRGEVEAKGVGFRAWRIKEIKD